MTPALGFGVIHERNIMVSVEISFFALPSKQGPVYGRFEPMHLPISLSTKVPACVRRFKTPTPLNHESAESKKDVSMLSCVVSFLEAIMWLYLVVKD